MSSLIRVLGASLFAVGCGEDARYTQLAKCDGLKQDSEEYVDAPFDLDGDGAVTGQNCIDEGVYDPDGFDCDDKNADVFPGQVEEACDGIDNDCDATTIDDSDNDADGESVCEGDCDDADDTVYSSAAEVPCNDKDDDCDPLTLDADDADGDGFLSCDDCDDTDDTIHPDAAEICNDGIDQNCVAGDPACSELEHVDLSDPEHGAVLWGSYVEDPIVYDFDGDGDLDVLVSGPWSDYRVLAAEGPIFPGDRRDLTDVVLFDDDDDTVSQGPIGFSIGDLDGHGDLPDLIVSRRVTSDTPPGEAWVFFDVADDVLPVAPADEDATFSGEGGSGSAWAQYLLQPRVADVTGDGNDDVIIGWNNGYDGIESGAFLYPGPIIHGTDNDISDAEVALMTGSYSGGTVGAVDDISGDGVAELYVAAGYTTPGVLHLLDATATGLGLMGADGADTTITGEGSSSTFFAGQYGNWADNVDAISESDLGGPLLIVGAPGHASDQWTGAVYLFAHTVWGTETTADDSARVIIRGNPDEALFIGCEVLLGDFNSDGSTDILAANCDSVLEATSSKHAWLIPGPLPKNGIYDIDDTELSAVRWDGAAHHAAAGDLNQDGRLDLVFGSAFFDLDDGSKADNQYGASVVFGSGE